MELDSFLTYIPEDVDLRPAIADAAWRYIHLRETADAYPSAPAAFLNRVITKTKCQKELFTKPRGSDPATEKINGWRKKDTSKRGNPLLSHATFYWFFRYEQEPSYFIELAEQTWEGNSEILKRFCYAKDGGQFGDLFGSIIERFKSSEAINYKVILRGKRQRLPATYAAAIELGSSYQAGRDEFRSAKKFLLSKRSTSVALTASIYGAGGYGKSCLAQELCNDEDVRKKFVGGIYWLQFGSLDSNDGSTGVVGLAKAIDRMLINKYPHYERPLWDSTDNNILKLAKILPDERLLLVADDLWTPQQWSWVYNVPAGVSVLVTTRRQSIAKVTTHEINIKRLTDEASYKLLCHGMTAISPSKQNDFRQLAKSFKGWPLLLSLANGVFKQVHGSQQDLIDKTLCEYKNFLTDDQIDAWDKPETGEEENKKRHKFVGFCIEAGLKAIPASSNPDLLRKLAVFPDDADIAFTVIIDFWNKCGAGRISSTKGLTLLRHFNDFSFFSSFNEDTQSLRLHNEILAYFRASAGKEQEVLLHCVLLDSIKAHCDGDWDTLPHNHVYGWTQIVWHLIRANLPDEANDLRTNFHWLKSNLTAVGLSELRSSLGLMPIRKDARLVGQAVDLSVAALFARPNSLAHQLYGRLSYETDQRLILLSEAARLDLSCWPRPDVPHLPPIGLEILRFHGYTGEFCECHFNLSGSRLITISSDDIVRLWDVETGMQIGSAFVGYSGKNVLDKEYYEFENGTTWLGDLDEGGSCDTELEAHRGRVLCAAFDLNCCKVVTAWKSTARLWDAETGIPIGGPLKGHTASITSAAFDPSGRTVVTTSEDKTARLWQAKNGAPIGQPLIGHDDSVIGAAFDLNGCKVVTVSLDNTVRLWDAKTGAPIGQPLRGSDCFAMSAAFDPSGCKVITTMSNRMARLWDAETGAPIGQPLMEHDGLVMSAAFDPSGRTVVTTSSNNTARLWDADTCAPIGRPLVGHGDLVTSAAFNPSGHILVTASSDKTARLWDAKTGAPIGKPLMGHGASVTSAVFDPSGYRVLTTSKDKTARLWDVDAGVPINGAAERFIGSIIGATVSPSGCKILAKSDFKTIRVWDAKTSAPIGKPLIGHDNFILSAVFDPSGCNVITASSGNTARLWDAKTGAPIGKPLKGHEGWITSVAFDPSGRTVVTASIDRTARLWDAKTGAPIGRPLEGHDGWVESAALDPRGHRVVTASRDTTARFWDAKTGAPIGQPLEGHTDYVVSAAFDPSGRTVVTASDDRTARLWDAKTGSSIGGPLSGHDGPITSAIFDPSGGKIVTISLDKMARLWDAKTGKPIGKPLKGHDAKITSVAFDPNKQRIITISDDRTAQVWDVNTGNFLAVVDFDARPFYVVWLKEHVKIILDNGLVCVFRVT